MHIWTIRKWQKYYGDENYTVRRGLRVICDKDIDAEVRRACKEFCKWLRSKYFFPIRVPIYLKNKKAILTRAGDLVSASICLPFDKDVEPYIRVAVGDYDDLLKKGNKDNALAAILGSISHELTHYFQWINDIQLTEIGEERQAKAYAGFIIDEYAETREHP